MPTVHVQIHRVEAPYSKESSKEAIPKAPIQRRLLLTLLACWELVILLER